jgi:hypothetical protein
MGIGDMKNRKRLRRARVDMIVRKNKPLPLTTRCEDIAPCGAPSQFRNGDKASYRGKAFYEITSGE